MHREAWLSGKTDRQERAGRAVKQVLAECQCSASWKIDQTTGKNRVLLFQARAQCVEVTPQ